MDVNQAAVARPDLCRCVCAQLRRKRAKLRWIDARLARIQREEIRLRRDKIRFLGRRMVGNWVRIERRRWQEATLASQLAHLEAYGEE